MSKREPPTSRAGARYRRRVDCSLASLRRFTTRIARMHGASRAEANHLAEHAVRTVVNRRHAREGRDATFRDWSRRAAEHAVLRALRPADNLFTLTPRTPASPVSAIHADPRLAHAG